MTSPHFVRIKSQVLAVMRRIPAGRLVTFRAVGDHLGVEARHVAYILATLERTEQPGIPWHRAVPEDGVLKVRKTNMFGLTQAELLNEEGHEVSRAGKIARLADVLFPVSEETTGLPRQERPGTV